ISARMDLLAGMPKLRRPELAAVARRRNVEQLTVLGGELRRTRKRRRLTLRALAALTSISKSAIASIELGHGGSHTLDTWQRLALALDRPLRVELTRDRFEETADAGHLAIQELVLRLGRK